MWIWCFNSFCFGCICRWISVSPKLSFFPKVMLHVGTLPCKCSLCTVLGGSRNYWKMGICLPVAGQSMKWSAMGFQMRGKHSAIWDQSYCYLCILDVLFSKEFVLYSMSFGCSLFQEIGGWWYCKCWCYCILQRSSW